MTSPSLDSRRIDRSSVRMDLRELGTMGIAMHMRNLGWGMTVETWDVEKEPVRFSVRFSRYDWHGHVCSGLGYGFSSPDLRDASPLEAEQEMAWTVRRSAELCLTVWDVFPEDLPGTPNIHGLIECSCVNDMWKEGIRRGQVNPSELFEAQKRRLNRVFPDGKMHIVEENGFFRFHVGRQHHEAHLLTMAEMQSMVEEVDGMRDKLEGKIAWGMGG
jgi:hypothetical protein